MKELYQSYEEKFSQHKIGLPKFCELRPKWCIPISSSGTHSVCVCTVHQNTKLIADAFCSAINKSIKKCERDFYKNKRKQIEADKEQEYEHKGGTEQNFSLFNATYKNMLATAVCDAQKMECMVHWCHKCPTCTKSREYVELKFQEYDIEEDITYSQWDRTDRTIPRTQTTPVDEFIELLVYQIDNLSKHFFITKSQPQYLKVQKEEIDEETCIILLDFAENYHFIVHDEVQGYHWNKYQCTLHPVVIYYKDQQNQLIHKSICVLSENLDHDTSFVHELQRLVCNFIQETLPQIKHIEYWSDGCAGQYKNFKNLMNLCNHVNDFMFHAIWSFFATSHGKSPCDGIGGTVMRKIAQKVCKDL